MTRINLVDPKVLTDQHLITEYRELPRIVGNVRKAIAANKSWQKDYAKKAPKQFVLGTGHMTFFYNKLQFLVERHKLLVDECVARGIQITHTDGLDISDIPDNWKGTYTPTEDEVHLSIARINKKISEKPDWYKFWKVSLADLAEQPCYPMYTPYTEIN